MHSEVAKNLDRLGALYTEQKKFAEAVHCYERSVFIWMKALGSESVEITSKYQKLAEVYAALDRPVDAEPLVKQVLTTRESETVTSLNTLASIYVARDNFLEAEPLYRLSITILDKRGVLSAKHAVSGSPDPNLELLADTASDYAELLKKMRRKGEATKLEARIRAIAGKQYNRKHS
jgi:tetratricopeptide (TPR) repeat protein